MDGTVTTSRKSAFAVLAQQDGFSLLEVLIALLVLAIGVLGAVLVQTNALRYSASAAYRTQATFIAYDLLDRMRANPANLSGYALTVSAGCATASPAASILETDLADFAHAVSCLLPAGHGAVEVSGQQATVVIGWSEERIVVGGGTTSLTVSSLMRGDP
ncbi:MAG: type IV pilus modification protein PilV [Pseudomonas sp.]